MSDQPQEPRYRRKPLAWEEVDPEHYECEAFGLAWQVVQHGRWWIVLQLDDGDFDDLEAAKARVEAEITRRLESVLEVCE